MISQRQLYQWCCEQLQRERPVLQPRLSDFERICVELRAGDVILIDGQSRADDALRAVTRSRWSRALLYLGPLHDIRDPALHHQLSSLLPDAGDTRLLLDVRLDGGLMLQPLSVVANEHLRICRPRNLSEDDIAAVIRHATARLGTGQPRSWFALLALLLPWALLPRRWRIPLFSLLAGSLLRQFTGTAVGDAFAFVRFPVLPLVKRIEGNESRLYSRYPGIFFAADFDHSPYLDIIKYPFVDQHHDGHTRLLPWHSAAPEQPSSTERKRSIHLL